MGVTPIKQTKLASMQSEETPPEHTPTCETGNTPLHRQLEESNSRKPIEATNLPVSQDDTWIKLTPGKFTK